MTYSETPNLSVAHSSPSMASDPPPWIITHVALVPQWPWLWSLFSTALHAQSCTVLCLLRVSVVIHNICSRRGVVNNRPPWAQGFEWGDLRHTPLPFFFHFSSSAFFPFTFSLPHSCSFVLVYKPYRRSDRVWWKGKGPLERRGSSHPWGRRYLIDIHTLSREVEDKKASM